MSQLVRLSLSLEQPLLTQLEQLLEKDNYRNRSEFIRDLIRDRLVEEEWDTQEEVVGTITMVYNHHARQLQRKLTESQHHHHEIVLATTHLHLTEDLCLEVIMTRGKAAAVQHLCGHLRQQKGVLHVTLSMTSTGAKLN